MMNETVSTRDPFIQKKEVIARISKVFFHS